MRRWVSLAAVAVILGALACSDSDDNNTVGPEQELDFIEHIVHGCAGEEEPPRSIDIAAFVKGYTLTDGFLTLTIGFTANCCPGFRESVMITGNHVQIDLADTLAECRCTCDFENDFTFACSGFDELNIRFQATDTPAQSFVSQLDTLLVLAP